MASCILINSPDDCYSSHYLADPKMPLGLLSIASYLRSHGIQVMIIDCHTGNYTQDQLIQIIKKNQPTLVGLNISTPNRKNVYEIVERIKKTLSDVVVIVGGPHASCLPDDVFRNAPHIDGVVMGEGEHVVLKVLNNLPHLHSFPGFYARNTIQEHLPTHFATRIEHLDSLPMPAYDLIDLVKYTSVSPELYISCSRGCTYNCVFCCSQVLLGRRVEFRTHNSVINEMVQLKELYDINKFYFYDDNLLIWPDFQAFCNKMASHAIKWTAQAAINDFDLDMIPLLLSGGCYRLSFGLESGSPTIQKYIRKIIKPDAGIKFSKLYQAGISSRAFFIIGFPHETIHDIAETAQYLVSLRASGLTDIVIFPARPFPGTSLFADCVSIYGSDKVEGLLEFQYLDDYRNQTDPRIRDKLCRYNTLPLLPINKYFDGFMIRTMIKKLYNIFFNYEDFLKMSLSDLSTHLCESKTGAATF